jgi:GNAT superfamily N-acetyltransferase
VVRSGDASRLLCQPATSAEFGGFRPRLHRGMSPVTTYRSAMTPAADSPVIIEPITSARWDDLVTVFGPSGRRASWCWCRRFLGQGDRTAADGNPDHRAELHAEIDAAAVPPGQIAMIDGTPAGWTRVGPRDGSPGMVGNRALARILTPDPGTWWVTCFVVARTFRGHGIGTALLNAAVDHAREHGATAVEGHPVGVENLTATSVGPSALFTALPRCLMQPDSARSDVPPEPVR